MAETQAQQLRKFKSLFQDQDLTGMGRLLASGFWDSSLWRMAIYNYNWVPGLGPLLLAHHILPTPDEVFEALTQNLPALPAMFELVPLVWADHRHKLDNQYDHVKALFFSYVDLNPVEQAEALEQMAKSSSSLGLHERFSPQAIHVLFSRYPYTPRQAQAALDRLLSSNIWYSTYPDAIRVLLRAGARLSSEHVRQGLEMASKEEGHSRKYVERVLLHAGAGPMAAALVAGTSQNLLRYIALAY